MFHKLRNSILMFSKSTEHITRVKVSAHRLSFLSELRLGQDWADCIRSNLIKWTFLKSKHVDKRRFHLVLPNRPPYRPGLCPPQTFTRAMPPILNVLVPEDPHCCLHPLTDSYAGFASSRKLSMLVMDRPAAASHSLRRAHVTLYPVGQELRSPCVRKAATVVSSPWLAHRRQNPRPPSLAGRWLDVALQFSPGRCTWPWASSEPARGSQVAGWTLCSVMQSNDMGHLD